MEQAGRWADRLSANVELPTQEDLDRLAPEKQLQTATLTMQQIREKSQEEERRFAPAGQTTQMIVGATESSDRTILSTATALYEQHQLRRIYYSAFSPFQNADARLPLEAPPLVREHRLYQADWLMRRYGFEAVELTTTAEPNLDLKHDPKLSWAMRNRDRFPVDVNRAPREALLRVPGIGYRNVQRILRLRRHCRLRLADLQKLRVVLERARPFIIAADHDPAVRQLDSPQLSVPAGEQLPLFAGEL